MAKFTPLTEDQIAESGLMPEGVYDFEITDCSEYQNDKGNDIFKLYLNVFDSEGQPQAKMDWVTPAFIKKFKHCVDACGLTSSYEAGEIKQGDFIGKTGKLKLKIGAPRENKDGEEVRYNEIEDYIKRGNLEPAKPMAKSVVDDEIPF